MVQSRQRPVRRMRNVVIALAVAALFSLSSIFAVYTDLLWFQEVGFSDVFWKLISTRVVLGAMLGALFFVFLMANLFVVAKIMPRVIEDPRSIDVLERYRTVLLPYYRRIAIVGGLVLAVVFGVGVSTQWDQFILFLNGGSFGRADPVFKRDLGFFVFKLPMYQVLYAWLFSSLALVTLIVAGAHYITGGIRSQLGEGSVAPHVKAHLSVLVGLIALVRAWGYRLDQYNLMYSTRGDVTGASFTDINAELPALKLLVVISVIGAILFLVNIRFKGWALPLAGLGLWFLTAVLAAGVFPFAVQRLRVEPAQLQKERPFIERNIKATRDAFGLDKVAVREYPAASNITKELVESNPETVENIRLFDPRILLTAYRQLEEFQTYYEFADVDVDRYRINGRPVQVMLAARELALRNLQSASWVNNHVFYTHGYGTVVSPTHEGSTGGRPKFLLQGIPPDGPAANDLKLPQGGIYYGELISDYSLVRTKQRELDYDEQEKVRYTRYSGKGGVELSGPMRRIAMAWRFRNINLLISDLIREDTRILYERRIRDRLSKSAPFLSFDGDAYPVISGGRVSWMVDAFTSTDMYPYSERVDFSSRTRSQPTGPDTRLRGTGNYVRNSVKAVVDAYDGSVSLYVWDSKDPIIRAWRKAFPALFKDPSQMPAGLQEHVRYPEDLFRIQTDIYARYHLTNAEDFFTRKNRWEIPPDPNTSQPAPEQGNAQAQSLPPSEAHPQALELQPYYVLTRLPGSSSVDYQLILPMNPLGKRNMVSYISANSDPENYGELTDFRFPKTQTIFGVGQIHSRINADPAFSRERTLLDREGSRLLFGNLLVIPIGESILYVQPMFLQSETNAIPELKFVVLATGDKIVLGDSLQEAINTLVAGGQPDSPDEPADGEPEPADGSPQPASTLLEQALEHYTRGEEALRRGDFATYGTEQKALKELLEKGIGRPGSEAGPSPSPSPSPAE